MGPTFIKVSGKSRQRLVHDIPSWESADDQGPCGRGIDDLPTVLSDAKGLWCHPKRDRAQRKRGTMNNLFKTKCHHVVNIDHLWLVAAWHSANKLNVVHHHFHAPPVRSATGLPF